jgi:hypothetical protein
MVRKLTREISYKFDKYEPKELFELLAKSIEEKSLRFPFPYETSNWQSTMIEFFRKKGEDAGYKVLGEMEWFRVDCPWLVDLPGNRVVELLMEHEDSDSLPKVLYDVKKLGHIKAYKKVIIYFPGFKNVDTHLKRIAEEIQGVNKEIKQTPQERWLIVAIGNQPKGKIAFRGYEFDAEGKHSLIGNREFDEDFMKE